MDRVRIELLAPILQEEIHREAQRNVLLAAAGGAPRWASIIAGVGGLLVCAGERLKTVECRRPAIVPPWIVAEACGCGK